jgi:hypothetical protein
LDAVQLIVCPPVFDKVYCLEFGLNGPPAGPELVSPSAGDTDRLPAGIGVEEPALKLTICARAWSDPLKVHVDEILPGEACRQSCTCISEVPGDAVALSVNGPLAANVLLPESFIAAAKI